MLKYIFFYSIGLICVVAQTGWQSTAGYQPYPQFNYTGNRNNPVAQGGSWSYTGGNPYTRPGNSSTVNSGYNSAGNPYNIAGGGYNPTRAPWANRTRQDSFLPGTTSWQNGYKQQSTNGSAGVQFGNLHGGNTGPYGITNTTGIGGRFQSNSGMGSWYNPTRSNPSSANSGSGYNPYPNVGYNASHGQGFTGQSQNRNFSGDFRGYGGNQGRFQTGQANYGQANPIVY